MQSTEKHINVQTWAFSSAYLNWMISLTFYLLVCYSMCYRACYYVELHFWCINLYITSFINNNQALFSFYVLLATVQFLNMKFAFLLVYLSFCML